LAHSLVYYYPDCGAKPWSQMPKKNVTPQKRKNPEPESTDIDDNSNVVVEEPVAKREPSGHRFVFTINNYTSEPTFDPAVYSYMVYGREKGAAKGTPHLQGYMEFISKKRVSTIAKIPDFQRAYLSPAFASPAKNRNYCTKGGDYFEAGNISVGAGFRSDLERAAGILRAQPNDEGLRNIAEFEPSTFIRYGRGMRELVEILTPPVPVAPTVLREWQQELYDKLQGEPDPRLIHFYVDRQGNTGKSFFAMHYYALFPSTTYLIGQAKHDRIYHNYKGQRVVIFDLARTSNGQEDHNPYVVMENIKNGFKPAGMYGAPPRIYPKPHVIVFMNQYPDDTALSSDRYDMICLATRL